MASPDPTSIGRFQVLRALGEGGMGTVFLARDPTIDREVAIKLMRTGYDMPDLRARFAREARAAGRIHHPNIVTIFEVGEENGEPFIVMEWVEGETVATRIARHDLTLATTLGLMDGICAGLHYAHRAGIVHRDIKPANVMVDGEGAARILDFGIARASTSDATIGATQPGTIVGTINYMSPEQLSGKPVDQRTDIFSAGALFYEMLTGRQAFPGDLHTGLLRMILLDGPEPIERVRPDLDEGLVAIVNHCLERDVDRRYADLGLTRKDLAAVRARLDQSTIVMPAPPSAATSPGRTPVPVASGGSAAQPAHTPGPDTRAEILRLRRERIDHELSVAQAALEREDYTQATQALQQALVVDPENPGALELQMHLEQIDSARHGLADAQHALEQRNLTAASSLVDRALALRPAMPEAIRLRAAIEEARRGATTAAAPAPIVSSGTAAPPQPTSVSPPAASPAPTVTPSTAAATVAPVPPSPEPVAAPVAAPGASGRSQGVLVAAAAIALLALGAGAFYLLSHRGAATPAPASVQASSTSTPPPALPPTQGAEATSPVTTTNPATPPMAEPPATDRPAASTEPGAPKIPPTSAAPTSSAVTPPSSQPSPSRDASTAITNKPASARAPAPKPADTTPASPPAIATAPPIDPQPNLEPVTSAPRSSPPGPRSRGPATAGLRGRVGVAAPVPSTPGAGMPSLTVASRDCDAGTGTSCTAVGLMYRNGRGAARDDLAASRYFQMGCERKDPVGCVDLGTLYQNGLGVAKSPPRAVALYSQGCDSGAAAGCSFLGLLYATGTGVPRNDVRALSLFERGCAGGHMQGCDDVGTFYRNGRAVGQDFSVAAERFQRACDGGYAPGCLNLGSLYEQGRGVYKSDATAATLYQRACDGRALVACVNLGIMYRDGRGVTKDSREADILFDKACRGGNANACQLEGGGGRP